MKIESGRVLDRLPAEERCRGAVFTSYSFDPAFFEENVLRAVLRLTSDPVEQVERYHNEARRALQETPVAVVVDAAERRAGRRLPYDLLEVSDVVFHPKSVLLLYRDFARLLIGSGNLTRPGFGENTELFVSTDLIYTSDADMSLLDGFDQHLGRIEALARRTGTQLHQIRDEIQRKSRSASPIPSAGLAFLDSTTGPIMDQFAALIPADALVTSVGMLAPFYETDDVDDAGVPDESSVFGAFAGRIAPESTLDVGLRWENPQIQPTAPTDLNEGLNRIWAFKSNEKDAVLAYRVPTELMRNTMVYLDGAGQRRRMPLDQAIASVEDRTFWMQPDPLVFAPRQTIANAAKRFSKVRYWLHPASRIADGRAAHRPLHAKMLAVAYRSGTDEATLILMGSPNMSRRALLLQSGKGLGNVEVGLAFSIEGRFELRDFVPDLVHVPPSACTPGDQTYLLSLYFWWKKLHGHTANAILSRFRDGEHDRVDVNDEKFLGIFDLKRLEPHLRAAFSRGKSVGAAGLDDLFESGKLSAFENRDAVQQALYRARFVLSGKLLPGIDLLIVDEAHKLKNSGSLRTRAMRSVFDHRFRKALFLTATPFQLDVTELREIFSLFSGAKDAPEDLASRIETLLAAVRDYQRQYDEFQRSWSSLDRESAARFCAAYDGGTDVLTATDDPAMEIVINQIAALKKLKAEAIEPGFREWMIRSLREDKRIYRRHERMLVAPSGANALPFLIYERYIAELFRRGRTTHKAAVEINMVSSFAAARQGSLLAEEPEERVPAEAVPYKTLLVEILGEVDDDEHEHPKLMATVKDALDAADRGEKTLIFCSRVATLAQLRKDLEAIWENRILERWRQVYPGAAAAEIFDTREEDEKRHVGRHSLLQARFRRPQDVLYLALRESYLGDAPFGRSTSDDLGRVVEEANAILQMQTTGKTTAERTDYQLAKYCVELAVLRLRNPGGGPDIDRREHIETLLRATQNRRGADPGEESFLQDGTGERPRWSISERMAETVLSRAGSLWAVPSDLLEQLQLPLRVAVVEQLARYLTYKQVPFFADLLVAAAAAGIATDTVESAALLEYLPQFWESDSGTRWSSLIRTFLAYFVERTEQQQADILDGPIKSADFARHTRDGEHRDRLREAFNTPLYPMILIANEVMQEGLDLHKHCRRVVHHDLTWNPAQIEQRIGRVDRLGSLTSRLRMVNPKTKLDVIYPVIRGTIDERLYRTVKAREKWLEFLLGASPDFSGFAFGDEDPPPLPERLGKELAIDLAPRSPQIPNDNGTQIQPPTIGGPLDQASDLPRLSRLQ